MGGAARYVCRMGPLKDGAEQVLEAFMAKKCALDFPAHTPSFHCGTPRPQGYLRRRMAGLSKVWRGKLAAVVLLWAALPGVAQKASSWRVFRSGDGLAEPACASVTLGSHGRILLRHVNQPFVSHMDGYTTRRIPAPEGGAKHVHESPAGQLWTATHKGLLEYKDEEWVLHPVDIIASKYAASPKRPLDLPMTVVRQGMVIFLLPDMLAVYYARDASRPRTEILLREEQAGIGTFTSLALARDGSLWVGGAGGLLHSEVPARNLRPDAVWRALPTQTEFQASGLQQIHEFEDGSLSVLANITNSGKAVLRLENGAWSLHPIPLNDVLFAWVTPQDATYAVTPSGLFESFGKGAEFLETDQVSARQYYDAVVEPGGAFFLATSDGLFRHAPQTWQVPPAARSMPGPAHSLLADRHEGLWVTAGNSLHVLHGDRRVEWPLPSPSLRSLLMLQNGQILLEGGGWLYTFDPDERQFRDVGGGQRNWRLLGETSPGVACVVTGETAVASSALNFNGATFAPARMDAELDALGVVLCVFSSQAGDVWLGAEKGVALLREGKWRIVAFPDGPAPEGVTAFVEQPDGKVWCAARDRLWETDGKSWTDLPRSFDRVNALLRARDGVIWAAVNSGCQRLFQRTWLEHGTEEGLQGGAVRDLLEDVRGRICAATSSGVALYHPEADTDPPNSVIYELRESDKGLPEGATVNLVFTGLDRWKCTPKDRLLFSYRLDQRDWSEFLDQTYVSFQDLSAGKHYFQVRAMDRSGNIDAQPARLEFSIVLPWYRETRLIGIASAGLVVAVFFAALAFNRHRHLVRSYQEVGRKVAERTKELEIANRELLQSQKMRALGTLAAGIAHDFNNILSIIKGSAQIIEQNLDNNTKVQTRVDRINTVVEQGAGIVKAMLGFSRESGQQGPCDINAVVEDTVKLLGDRFLHEVRVSSQLASQLPPVITSKDLVQQVLLNFVFNAAEAMTNRKEIIVATRLINAPPPETVLAPAPSDVYVGISVTDYGCGIPPENLLRIFEPFFTTKAFSARRGTGLGLSMVYELAKRLDAGLSVDSIPGRGSTFVLVLPLKPVNNEL